MTEPTAADRARGWLEIAEYYATCRAGTPSENARMGDLCRQWAADAAAADTAHAAVSGDRATK